MSASVSSGLSKERAWLVGQKHEMQRYPSHELCSTETGSSPPPLLDTLPNAIKKKELQRRTQNKCTTTWRKIYVVTEEVVYVARATCTRLPYREKREQYHSNTAHVLCVMQCWPHNGPRRTRALSRTVATNCTRAPIHIRLYHCNPH